MSRGTTRSDHRPRELRRGVVLPARLRTGGHWSDTCILNILSRGLMIHSLRAGPEGSIVALYRGNHVITAEIVWREGARVGLQAHDRVPVEEILSVDRSATLRLAVAESVTVERRRAPRPVTADEARFRGRAMQFAGVTAAGLCLAIGAAALIEQAFAKPLAAIESALRSQS